MSEDEQNGRWETTPEELKAEVLKLWLLVCFSGPRYDSCDAMVVRSNDEAGARYWASQHAGDETAEAWLRNEPGGVDLGRLTPPHQSLAWSTCEEIDPAGGLPGLVLRSFNAG